MAIPQQVCGGAIIMTDEDIWWATNNDWRLRNCVGNRVTVVGLPATDFAKI